MILGGHLSIAEGLRFGPVNARALGYQCFQTMLSVGGDFRPFSIEQEQLDEFKKLMFGVDLYIHFPYLINTCEAAAQRRDFFLATFQRFYSLSRLLGAKAVILHLGNKQELEEDVALANTVGFLEKALDDSGPHILLETDAGSNSGSIVGSLEFIDEILTQVREERLRMCLDTEHLWARGINLWDTRIRELTLRRFGKWIELVHLNVPDPGVDLGSHVDKHNSAFIDFKLDSKELIRAMLNWPCILERQSLALQRADIKYIRQSLS